MTKRTKASTKTPTATTATSLPTVKAMVAGIDIGSSQHWVCGPARDDDGKPAIRSFGTTTVDLEALVDWLATQGTKSVAMESTSVYWIPLYELLEARGIEPVLVNARQKRKHIRARLVSAEPIAPSDSTMSSRGLVTARRAREWVLLGERARRCGDPQRAGAQRRRPRGSPVVKAQR
jgi:hypothetical protein